MRLKLQKRSERKLVSRIIPLNPPLSKGDIAIYNYDFKEQQNL
jgi:hypothetical protein